MSNNWFLYSPLERAWLFLDIEQAIKSAGFKYQLTEADGHKFATIELKKSHEIVQLEFECDEFIKIIFFKEYTLDFAFSLIKLLAQNLGDDIFLAEDSGSFNIPVHLLNSWEDRANLLPNLQNMDFTEAREYALQQVSTSSFG